MNTFEQLYEAMSRRSFLKGGAKKSTPPDKPIELTLSTPAPKPPKKISRRTFIKKTGAGSALTALNPVDLALQGWPAIISQVVPKIDPKVLLNKSLLSYAHSLHYTSTNSEFTPVEIVTNIVKSLGRLAPQNERIVKDAFDFLNFELASTYSDKFWNDNLTKSDQKTLDKLIKNIFTDKNYREGTTANRIESFMYSIQEPDLQYGYFEDIIQGSIKNNLMEIETAEKFYTMIKDEEISFSDKIVDSLKNYILDNGGSLENNSNQKNKNDEKVTNNTLNSIDYSRLDKAGSSEDVQGKDYTTLEQTSFDSLVNRVLQEKKDRCYHRAVQAYGTKTSAYRSAAMVKCRKGKIWKKKK